ncbi:HNH endonuclease [Achromobacter piechaudii]|uniref:HNH endonuclease n=1 Tax=Achromobacter piechaudii TaxID=72556 RepID=UPI0015824035|nr:HNH endonuclease [Achromobacter piechaudii]
MKTLPIEYLHEALSYDPDSGLMRWKERPRHHFASDRGWRCFNSRFAGKPAGTVSPSTGYVVVNFNGSLFGVHRVAVAMSTGEWPPLVDHVDGSRSSNRLENLRVCSKSQNLCNRGKQANNTSGFKGVTEHQPGRWRARINLERQYHHLGVFPTAEAAHHAYEVAASHLHGRFANAGQPGERN